MNIIYDYQIFQIQKYGGISKYHASLSAELATIQGIKVNILAKKIQNEYLSNSLSYCKNIEKFQYRASKKGRILYKYYEWQNQKLALKALKNREANIFHATFYHPYFLKAIKSPLVITVHDMIYELFPQYFPKNGLDSKRKKLLCERADLIICNSQSTKHDLKRIWKIPEKKIAVTHLFSEVLPSKKKGIFSERLPKKYLLYVGERTTKYKNFLPFLETISTLLHKDKNLSLVCTGAPFSATEIDFFDKFKIRSSIYHFSPLENQFYDLYHQAKALVYPSRYEGFGLPVLEAFSANCPVVASYNSALKEVGKDAILYFDPLSKNSMKAAIEKIVYQDEINQDFRAKGKERFKDFSRKKLAAETLAAYTHCINNF